MIRSFGLLSLETCVEITFLPHQNYIYSVSQNVPSFLALLQIGRHDGFHANVSYFTTMLHCFFLKGVINWSLMICSNSVSSIKNLPNIWRSWKQLEDNFRNDPYVFPFHFFFRNLGLLLLANRSFSVRNIQGLSIKEFKMKKTFDSQ